MSLRVMGDINNNLPRDGGHVFAPRKADVPALFRAKRKTE